LFICFLTYYTWLKYATCLSILMKLLKYNSNSLIILRLAGIMKGAYCDRPRRDVVGCWSRSWILATRCIVGPVTTEH